MQDTFPAMKRIKGSFRASFALIILAAAGLVLAQTKTEPLRLQDILDINVCADRQPLALSADGKLAAVAMVRPNHSASFKGTAVS